MPKEILSHYTNLDSLQKIINGRSLKFTSIINVNDPNEANIPLLNQEESCIQNLYKQSIYISSWTKENKETIPMWYLYGNMQGLRIDIPYDCTMFDKNILYETCLPKDYNGMLKSCKDIDLLLNSKIKIDDPIQVNYVQDLLSNNTAIQQSNYTNHTIINLKDELINKKLKCWEFEKEVRFYISNIKQICYDDNVKKSLQEHGNLFKNLFPNYLLVPLSSEFFKNFKILLAPQFSKNSIKKLKDILCNNNINTDIIQESEIKTKFYFIENHPLEQQIGEQIKSFRENRQLTVEQLSNLLNIKSSTLGLIEHGEINEQNWHLIPILMKFFKKQATIKFYDL